MSENLINIRTDKFTKDEIKVMEDCLKEWKREEIVDIVYLGEGTSEKLDVSFTLKQKDLGDFLWLVFGCGYEFVYKS
jgi:hypothetical protein